jgi:flagellar basal-body rod modification protein FlgD
MQVNSTSNTLYSEEKQDKSPTQQLDKDAFLKILVSQLRYQNPLNPQDSSAFIDQVVQLTSVEQMTKLASNMQKMLDSQEFNRAVNLIGHDVTVLGQNEEIIQGAVEKITMVEGRPYLVIEGLEYSMDNLVSIAARTEPESSEGSDETEETGEQEQAGESGSSGSSNEENVEEA